MHMQMVVDWIKKEIEKKIKKVLTNGKVRANICKLSARAAQNCKA